MIILIAIQSVAKVFPVRHTKSSDDTYTVCSFSVCV